MLTSIFDLLLLISIACIVYSARKYYLYYSMNAWVEVSAVILSINEEAEKVLLSEVASMNYYYPRMKYRYHYGDVTYQSDIVGNDIKSIWMPEFDDFSYPTKREDYFWNNWKKGGSIKVFINPKKPEKSIIVKPIERKDLNYEFLKLFCGIAILLVWLFLKA
ncbi:MAG: DUF3592 domain-containing protein [Gammaproteobacteria bacterium]